MNLIGRIQRFFRNKALRRDGSKVPSGMMPVSDIRTAAFIIDVEDSSFDVCKQSIQSFSREYGMKTEIFFLDMRKIGSEDRLITSITNTILARDLNWFGKPSDEKMKLLLDFNPDLFVSLVKDGGFPADYVAACCTARFKIGRRQLPGKVFDLVVSDPPGKDHQEAEVFGYVKNYLLKITDNK